MASPSSTLLPGRHVLQEIGEIGGRDGDAAPAKPESASVSADNTL
jgi:hypothetical protein